MWCTWTSPTSTPRNTGLAGRLGSFCWRGINVTRRWLFTESDFGRFRILPLFLRELRNELRYRIHARNPTKKREGRKRLCLRPEPELLRRGPRDPRCLAHADVGVTPGGEWERPFLKRCAGYKPITASQPNSGN